MNYFKNHPSYNYDINLKYRDGISKKYSMDLMEYLEQIKNSNMLEVGTGIGNFAYFCKKLGVKNYTGIDIDDYFFKYHEKEFKNYKFEKARFQDYLDGNKKFDAIFTSHLFEHLNEVERIEIIQSIYKSLNKGGIWINYMPNADTTLSYGFGAVGDITHYRIYNSIAFEQVINLSEVKFSSIKHLNTVIGYNFIKKFIHSIFKFITKIYYLGMGRNFPAIYTWEII